MKCALSVSVIQRGRSGVAAYVFGLLDGLAAMKHRPEMHIFGLQEDEDHFGRWREWVNWHPVSEFYRPPLKNVFWHQCRFPVLLKRVGVDVVHIPSYRRMIARPGCCQVVTIHDMAPFHVEKKYDPARMIYGRQVVPRLVRCADRIITVSEATAADVRRYGSVSEEKIDVIWNGIDHTRFQPQPQPGETSLLKAGDTAPPYWIYLARLEHPAKNHVRLIEAFESFCRTIPGVPHHLVFGGADWHGAEVIHERIARSECRERIHVLGFVDDSDLPVWYRHAEALVYPSLFEGFGLPPIEAMACGCPVISSGAGSLEEVTGDAALRVDPGNVDSIAEAMERLAAWTAEERRQWVERGIAHAGCFAWSLCAEKALQSYRQAMEGVTPGDCVGGAG